MGLSKYGLWVKVTSLDGFMRRGCPTVQTKLLHKLFIYDRCIKVYNIFPPPLTKI